MRTIKFKAKTLMAGEWIVGDLVCANGKTFIKNEDEPDKVFPICKKVDPDTVCQFTGFLDKNGKEIYEGDVLRSDEYPYSCIGDKERDNYFGLIEWNENEAAFYIVTIKNPKSSVKGISDGISDYISQSALQDFEVIGNIYDDEWKQFREHL